MSDFMTWKEMRDIASKEEAELARRVKSDNDGIMLDGHYQIEWDRCNNSDKILVWSRHLMMKGWITPDMIIEVIDLATKHHNIKLPGSC